MEVPKDTSKVPDPPDGNEATPQQHASFRDKLLSGQGRVNKSGDCNENVEINGNVSYENQKDAQIVNKALQPQEEGISSGLDQTHGEWLMVSRSRKKTQVKGKGKLHEDSIQGKEQKTNRGFADGKKKTLSVPKPTPEVTKKVHEVPKQANEYKFVKRVEEGQKKLFSHYFKPTSADGNFVFNSKADGNSALAAGNKKRLRLDPPSVSCNTAPPNIVNNSTLVISNGSSKIQAHNSAPSVLNSNDPKFGIQTFMDVEILGPNRLRFKEVKESTGDASLEKSLDKHLEVHLQPHHVSDDRQDDSSDDAMAGQEQSSGEDSEHDEDAMSEESSDEAINGNT
ncbi:phosphatidylinositol 4-kinase [Sesbania bispinosa]|nr:phosphatidylinositol 4-kinase [Sesbania bispinosa]